MRNSGYAPAWMDVNEYGRRRIAALASLFYALSLQNGTKPASPSLWDYPYGNMPDLWYS
jgi:hypothetical protein